MAKTDHSFQKNIFTMSDNTDINQDRVYSLMRKHRDGIAIKYAKGRSAAV